MKTGTRTRKRARRHSFGARMRRTRAASAAPSVIITTLQLCCVIGWDDQLPPGCERAMPDQLTERFDALRLFDRALWNLYQKGVLTEERLHSLAYVISWKDAIATLVAGLSPVQQSLVFQALGRLRGRSLWFEEETSGDSSRQLTVLGTDLWEMFRRRIRTESAIERILRADIGGWTRRLTGTIEVTRRRVTQLKQAA